jgi:hypothetical protein
MTSWYYSDKIAKLINSITVSNYCPLNLLAPEFGIEILAHSVYKMRIIQKPKEIAF